MRRSCAVLFSSGLDSAVLAASEARTHDVHPLYVSTGLAWEGEELAAVDRLLAAPAFKGMASIARLTFTVADLYPPTHWALRGTPPAFDTPDEDVYLTGRNIILLSKALDLLRAAEDPSHRDRTIGGQSVSRRDTRVLHDHGARALARAGIRPHNRRAVRDDGEKRGGGASGCRSV
jgi:7-cyano-7-deazaguanine synthase in queuosine biosynthesis